MEAKVSHLLDEYKAIFGESHLAFSTDLKAAQDELKKLQEKKTALSQTRAVKQGETLLPSVRLAEYEAAIKHHNKRTDIVDLSLPSDKMADIEATSTKKSRLEILAEERDMKRRRQTYKGGKTHTGKKSYTEVMREVIEKQSEALQDMMSYEKKNLNRDEYTKHL